MSQSTMESSAPRGLVPGVSSPLRSRVLRGAADPHGASRELAAARKVVLSAEIAGSWERSLRAGLRPQTARGVFRGVRPAFGRLHAVADAVARSRADDLRGLPAVLLLTDAEGTLLSRWGDDGWLEAVLRAAGIEPGHAIGEACLGTSSVATLVRRRSMYVHGLEHFADTLSEVTTAGAVISHPVTRRVLGSLHVVTPAASASPATLAWLHELVREVDRRMSAVACERDRLMMESFLEENRDGRHAVVAVNEQTILTNAAAARIVGVEEQAVLWERALAVMRGDAGVDAVVEVGGGTTLRVHYAQVIGPDDAPAGVILRLKRIRADRCAGVTLALPGLVGSGAAWEAMAKRLSAAGSAPVLLVGERGTGKASIGRALAPDRIEELDLRALAGTGTPDVAGALGAAIARLAPDTDHSSSKTVLLIRGLDRLPAIQGQRVRDLLARLPSGVKAIGTSTAWPGTGGFLDVVADRFPVVVPVPGLAERSADIPELVRAFTNQYAAEQGLAAVPQWMTDALQALTRLRWSDNVRGLQDLVHVVLARTSSRYVTVHDLPAEALARASRRSLAGLEHAEARAILQALEDAEGNKYRAAEALGIARSTLYRKMRSLGLDLSASAY